jgi:hypothetical protein
MPQMHFSVDDQLAAELTRRAGERGVSLSRYLADLVKEATPSTWPAGYLRGVVGSCANALLEEPHDLPLDDVACL